MKTKLLAFALLLMSGASYASHLMGGQITSRNVGGLTYEVTLTVYRDMTGIPVSPAQIHYENAGVFSVTHPVPIPAAVNIGNGVEEYTYVDVVTFPAVGNYHIWYYDCCRNAAILNIVNPDSHGYFIENILLADTTNSSPVFLNPPIPIAQLNNVFNYNPLPYDADGDSIAWVLDTPLDANTSGNSSIISGYQLPFADTSLLFTMNPVTGEMSLLPNTLGHFQVSCVVKEYRGGVAIGQIRRDMQIIVISSANAPVHATVNSNTTGNTTGNTGGNTSTHNESAYAINAGSALTLTVTGYDADNLMVTMSADGAPFHFANNAATFTTTYATGVATGVFAWSPIASQARATPYIVCVRIMEQYNGHTFEKDMSFSILVENAKSVIDNITAEVIRSIYPNPTQGNFVLELNCKQAGTVVYHVQNMIGEQMTRCAVAVNAGVNVVDVNGLHLQTGKYFLSVEEDGKTLAVKGFEVVR